MNRLSPWIARRTRNEAAFTFPPGLPQLDLDQAAGWLRDARLFATGWVAGLIFFGTLFA
jgi:hypothetical protein